MLRGPGADPRRGQDELQCAAEDSLGQGHADEATPQQHLVPQPDLTAAALGKRFQDLPKQQWSQRSDVMDTSTEKEMSGGFTPGLCQCSSTTTHSNHMLQPGVSDIPRVQSSERPSRFVQLPPLGSGSTRTGTTLLEHTTEYTSINMLVLSGW